MDMDPIAVAKIEEQAEEINDLHILLDLAGEDRDEWKARCYEVESKLRASNGQLALLRSDRRVEVG